MSWVYRSTYVGPDRRSPGFVVRFLERRREANAESAGAPANMLRELWSKGMAWVDHFNYFGPDRRGADFSFFFFERRRSKGVGRPPALHTALRQLRVRLADAKDAEGRSALQERLTATALLAAAQGFSTAADALKALASDLDASRGHEADPRPRLDAELGRIESMLV